MAAAPELNVSYVARLARLELTPDEIAEYQTQLGDVLKYVEALSQVDVSDVEPTAHASAVFNVFRDDAPTPSLTPAAALSNAPRQANGLFIVTKVVE
jgi:aspartyl-tRNA(Asn)/glutamyl-tRNA(Gln) amidotransferase subunit C